MNFRHTEILARVRRDGKVTVEALATDLNVTLQTIRRDLADLTDAGRVERVHGGAILPTGLRNIAYEDRRRLNADAKARIGQACASRINPGSAIFLGIGTTCEAVAHALVHHDGLLVMTNNLNAAPILAANPACEIRLTGGALRAADMGLVGAQAAASARQFKFDLAVIGCSALDLTGDFFDYDPDEVIISQTVIEKSHATAIVADASKFERTAPARVANLSDLGFFCTDAPLPSLRRSVPNLPEILIG